MTAIREEDVMTDNQFNTILEMVGMILDGCENLEDAKGKIKKLQKTKETDNNDQKQ